VIVTRTTLTTTHVFASEMRLDIDEQSNGDWSGQARLEMSTNVRPSSVTEGRGLSLTSDA
jgi:hypothetical protein